MTARARTAPYPVRLVRSRMRRRRNQSLHRRELQLGRRGADGSTPLAQTPIFIVGAPRSGSTLLFQLMVDRFDVAYLTNAHARWPGGPAVVEQREQHLRRVPADVDYESSYGATSGDLGPSECGEYWYRFFPRAPHHVPVGGLDASTLADLRASVRAFGDVTGRPIVYKNLYSTVRMRPLAEALPEALFIWITRDVVENAQSLLEGRHRMRGSYDEWFSVEPPDVDALRLLPPAQQVVEQVRALDALVRCDADAIGVDRIHHVTYADLCDSPRDQLDAIAGFTARHGVDLVVRAEVPGSFPRRGGDVRVDQQLYEALVSAAAAG